MTTIDQDVLGVLKSRAVWGRGPIHLSVEEVQTLISSRFSKHPCPNPNEVRASVRRLVRGYKIRWARVTDNDIWFLA